MSYDRTINYLQFWISVLVLNIPLLKLNLSQVSAEKAMATHSSTLAWKIPWTEEPG